MVEKVLLTPDNSQIVYDLYPRLNSETLVLIHGNAGNRHYFDAQLAIYRRNFQVITFDSRAHGQSSNSAKALTFAQIAEDLADLLKIEHIDNAAIVGFSDGANVAMVFAKHYPEMVNCLVLNAGNVRISGLLLWVRFVDELLYWTTKIFSFTSARLRRYLQIQRLLIQDLPLEWSDLETIGAPTLVISGDHDVVRQTHTRKIAASFPNSELTILHGGHSFGRKYPITFAKKVTDFIKHRGTV